MPGVMRRYDIKSDGVNELGHKEREARLAMINDYWRWRDGEHPASLKVAAGERDDNVRLNLCGQMIDVAMDYVGAPRWMVAGGTDNVQSGEVLVKQVEPAQETLDMITNSPEWAQMYRDLLESGMVAGHGFVRIIPPDGVMNAQNPPKFAGIDPRYVTVFWDVTQIGTKKSLLWYRIMWEADVIVMQDILPDALLGGTGENWWIIQYEATKAGWVETGRDVWDYPFAPIVDFKMRQRAHEYYGRSLLAGQTGLNSAVNFVASNTGRIIKFHAHPRTIITGGDVADLQESAVDGLYSFPDPDTKVQNLEMESDLQSSLNYLAGLRDSFFSQARVVDPASVKDKAGALTNFGIRAMFSDQIKLVEKLRESIETGLREALQRGMWMAGFAMPIMAVWEDTLPVDRLAVVDAVEREVALGVMSRQTAADELGRDYVGEQEKIAEERATSIDVASELIQRTANAGLLG